MSDTGLISDGMPASVSTATVMAEAGEVVVVTVIGEIDMLTDALMRKEIAAALEGPGTLPVVVDMTGVTFFGSSGIAALAAARADAQERGLALHLAIEPGSNPDRALHMMGMAQLLQIHPTRNAAIHAVAPSP